MDNILRYILKFPDDRGVVDIVYYFYRRTLNCFQTIKREVFSTPSNHLMRKRLYCALFFFGPFSAASLSTRYTARRGSPGYDNIIIARSPFFILFGHAKIDRHEIFCSASLVTNRGDREMFTCR